MKLFTLLTAAAASAILISGSAYADTINFGQFGPAGTVLGNVITGTTVGGDGFTMTGVGYGFTVLSPDVNMNNNPGYWSPSQFNQGQTVLYDGDINTFSSASGPVKISFANAITSFQFLGAEAGAPFAYTFTLTAFNGNTQVAQSTYFNDLSVSGAGTLPGLSVSAAAITSIQFSTYVSDQTLIANGFDPTQYDANAQGFAFGAAPEASTWLMMILGFGALGFAGYRQQKRLKSSATA